MRTIKWNPSKITTEIKVLKTGVYTDNMITRVVSVRNKDSVAKSKDRKRTLTKYLKMT